MTSSRLSTEELLSKLSFHYLSLFEITIGGARAEVVLESQVKRCCLRERGLAPTLSSAVLSVIDK